MKVPYEPAARHVGRRGKYPWSQMRHIGDYFDLPPGTARGIRNACYNQKIHGRVYRTHKMGDGTTRVMLVEVEEGAI